MWHIKIDEMKKKVLWFNSLHKYQYVYCPSRIYNYNGCIQTFKQVNSVQADLLCDI